MKLVIPVFGMIFGVATCCCFGQNPSAGDGQTEQTGTGSGVTSPAPGERPGPPTEPPPPPSPSAAASTPPAPLSSGTHEGVLKTGSRTLVVLTTTGGSPPPVGASGTLSKQVSRKVMGADMTMWLGIATGTVTAANGTSVTLAVTEVTFDATVNGKKVDPFEKGVTTRLEWTE